MAISTTQKSTAPFRIRPAVAADAPAIASLGARVFTDTFAYSMPAKDCQHYLDETYTPTDILQNIHNPAQTILVAVALSDSARETLAGFLILIRGTSEPCIALYPAPIELQRLYIDAAFQGSGIAKALVDAGEALARHEGCESMWLGVWEENFRAQRFYEKFGYEQVGSHDFVMGETTQTDLIAVKRL